MYLLGSASLGRWLAAAPAGLPRLAPGAPTSPERLALIEAFKTQSRGLEKKFETRTHDSDWAMPYRLFRPATAARVPLVIYLHGSGGSGTDNERQLAFGNIFGTRVWLLPENQKRFPCYVVAPQTDRGWIRYDADAMSQGTAKAVSGLGDGARLAFEIVDALCRELPIDRRRIYVAGQSMGGAGVWNMLTFRPHFFGAAVICCGSDQSLDDGTGSIETPLWNFHGDSDQTVPVSASRKRIAARRKAGGRPLYTEYAGVDHNAWEWAFTEPALVSWVFGQGRAS
ncbi:MAG TPA: phospholipase [Thermoanaerobaculia bacterium]|nr:phospholipase [Thermoanaerobaculia bacterium]